MILPKNDANKKRKIFPAKNAFITLACLGVNWYKSPNHYGPMIIDLNEYLPILMFLAVAVGLSLVVILIPAIVALKRPDAEKLSSYECGFEPFSDARNSFDVRFYLVSILFIIFDLEIAFLFPWAVSLSNIGLFGFYSMMIFLAVLTIGFAYEWKKGALEWE